MKEIYSEYTLILQQEVIWGDIDAFGHINNTVYFRYFEDVRMAYFEKIGVQRLKEDTGLGPILATTQCNFRLPLEYPDRIHIAGRTEILGPRKFNMHYCVFSEKFNAVAAEGDGLLVYYNYHERQAAEIPSSIVERIKSLENNSG